MSLPQRDTVLRFVLVIVGLVSLFGVYPLMQLWPDGWRWRPHHPPYEHMIVGVYATLGVFLLLATRQPVRHRSLILFASWSSLVHGSLMAIDALRVPGERGHLVGDVPIVLLAGVLLLALAPRAERSDVT